MTKELRARVRRASAACALTAAALLAVCCSALERKMNPYLDREIHGPITISQDWIEVTPPEPLKAEREVNNVMLLFETPYQPDWEANGLRFPDGSVVVPEVKLIDSGGNSYQLSIGGLSGKGMLFGKTDPATHLDSLPKDRVYVTVKLRSDKPIRCSKIVWHSYNTRDMK